MSRKIYLAMKAFDCEEDFDAHDCLDDVEEDWEDDSGGKHYLGGADFFKCWFQLADLNTKSVSGAEYAGYLTKITEAFCLPGGGYRDDLDLLERIRDAAEMDDDEFEDRRARWFAEFHDGPGSTAMSQARSCVAGRDGDADAVEESEDQGDDLTDSRVQLTTRRLRSKSRCYEEAVLSGKLNDDDYHLTFQEAVAGKRSPSP
eukprot:6721400-Prymnesium_polylepis.1